MRVLLIGSGGREHALAWKLAQSPRVERIYAAPGNPGIARLGECLAIEADDIDRLLDVASEKRIDWTVVGPEAPLCAGIVDRFAERGFSIFGPTEAAAKLEGSKVFAKEFMARNGIPTAPFQICSDAEAVRRTIQERGLPQVIKADGLAAGKGVFVCREGADVEQATDQIFRQKAFGTAGERVVVEDCLTGVEASFLVFSDGTHVLPLAPAKDHKAAFDGDEGPNTGGMGTYSPTPALTPELQNEIVTTIVQPTIVALKAAGTPFRGILYVGLMLTASGPYVLEYNVRLGDPEAQVILPRLKTDLVDILEASRSEGFASLQLAWYPYHAVCVVLASRGYPGSYPKGHPITGLETITDPDIFIFHAGTKTEGKNLVTAGGRVLGVTGIGDTLHEAREKVYAAVRKIHFDGMHYRKDIGMC